MHLGSLYIMLTAIAVGIAWLSHHSPTIRCAHWLLFSCVASNLAVDAMGFVNAPMLIPALDAFVALVGILPIALGIDVASVERPKSRTAAAIFALFLVVGFVHVVAFTTHRQGTYLYFLVLNLLFAAQVLVVGGVSGYRYLSHRPRGLLHRAGGAPSRG